MVGSNFKQTFAPALVDVPVIEVCLEDLIVRLINLGVSFCLSLRHGIDCEFVLRLGVAPGLVDCFYDLANELIAASTSIVSCFSLVLYVISKTQCDQKFLDTNIFR